MLKSKLVEVLCALKSKSAYTLCAEVLRRSTLLFFVPLLGGGYCVC